MILKIKIEREKRRIPLPEKGEQIFKVKKAYTRKMKHKKDWRLLEDEEIEYEEEIRN